MKSPSLRRQLVIPVLCGYLSLSFLSVVALNLLVRHFLVRQTEAYLTNKAMLLRFLAESPTEVVPSHFEERLEVGLFGLPRADRFEFWREDGSVLIRSPSLGKADLPRKSGAQDEPVYWDLLLADGRRATALGLAFKTDRDRAEVARRGPSAARPGLTYLVVASDRHEQDEALDRLRLISWILAGLFVASSLLIPRLVDRLLRPLTHLMDETSRVDVNSLSTRFEADSLPVELASIAACLNALFERLEGAFERERRVSADLAHELRTPISELKVWAELALRWPERSSADAHRTTLAVANHMEEIVSTMLLLARSEQGALPVDKAPIALGEFLREAWQPFEERASGKQLRIVYRLESLRCVTDPALLKSILWNLYDNAVEYTSAGGEIAISCLAAGRHPVLEVSNRAVGIAQPDLARLFERFWRKDPARMEGRHVGLGLAIVRSFAAALGIEITVDVNAQQLITFRLIFAQTELEA